MSDYYFYNLETGRLQPGTMVLPDQEAVEKSTPPGCAAIIIPGGADWRTQRVDVETLKLVACEAPELPLEWVEDETRRRRDSKLAACDWVVTRSMETGESVPLAWRQYRQALRDAPTQSGWPRNVEWPTPPAS